MQNMEINKKQRELGIQELAKSKKIPLSLSSNNINELVNTWVGICIEQISFKTKQN
jgi:hypothetical protein